MISDLSLDFRLDDDMIAEVLEDTKNPTVGDKIKVRVPKFMDTEVMDIRIKDPYEQESAYKPDNGILVNDGDCQVEFSDELIEINYVEGCLENNSNLSKVFTMVRSEVGHTISAWLKKTNEKTGKPTVLRCTFKNSKLTQLKLNSMDTTDDISVEEIVE